LETVDSQNTFLDITGDLPFGVCIAPPVIRLSFDRCAPVTDVA
jgi:hypothetical protein